jgi:anaerobic selenocysteine-containing dehydrogenase
MRPLYDTRATVDVLLALARDLQGAVAKALPWPNEVEFLKEMMGAWRQETSAEAFWSSVRRQGGIWSETPETRTLSVSSVPAPVVPTAPRADPEYPYHLHLYPSLTLFDGRGANKPWLQETPDPMTTVSWQTWIEINPNTAEQLGVKDNDVVLVASPAGEVEAIVYVFHGIGEGVVGMPVGRGHEDCGRYAAGHGSNPVRLLSAQTDEETGALTWAATRVKIVPTGRRHPLARLESAEGVEHLRASEH